MKRIKEKYDSVRIELNIEHDSWFDYYDHGLYYDYSDYYDHYDSNNYGYVDKEFSEELITGPIFRRRKHINKYFPYVIVDMNSIYTRAERRNKIIDEILGNNKNLKPTFADIWKG